MHNVYAGDIFMKNTNVSPGRITQILFFEQQVFVEFIECKKAFFTSIDNRTMSLLYKEQKQIEVEKRFWTVMSHSTWLLTDISIILRG